MEGSEVNMQLHRKVRTYTRQDQFEVLKEALECQRCGKVTRWSQRHDGWVCSTCSRKKLVDPMLKPGEYEPDVIDEMRRRYQ